MLPKGEGQCAQELTCTFRAKSLHTSMACRSRVLPTSAGAVRRAKRPVGQEKRWFRLTKASLFHFGELTGELLRRKFVGLHVVEHPVGDLTGNSEKGFRCFGREHGHLRERLPHNQLRCRSVAEWAKISGESPEHIAIQRTGDGKLFDCWHELLCSAISVRLNQIAALQVLSNPPFDHRFRVGSRHDVRYSERSLQDDEPVRVCLVF